MTGPCYAHWATTCCCIWRNDKAMLQAFANHSLRIDSTRLQEWSLCCPRCGLHLAGPECDEADEIPAYNCRGCGFALLLEGGIWRALPSARLAYFSRFINDYQGIRAAEGRGSEGAEYYLNLPDRDASGHNREQWKIRARTFHYLRRKLLPSLFAEAQGTPAILDLGAGNGWLSYRLAIQGCRPVAVDILDNDQDGLGAARHYVPHLQTPFPRFQAEAAHLPFESHQFDAVIFNASFHYAEDYTVSLREALRCTRAGGAVIIADSPWYSDPSSGEKMMLERKANFLTRFGTASDSIASLAYLTDDRLHTLERECGIEWQLHEPGYGLRWALRPVFAKIRGRREPARFRVYFARKNA